MSCYHQQFQPRAQEMAKVLKVLSHPNRLLLLAAIGDEELSVGELEAKTSIKQPVLSRELARLREEKLVETERQSKQIIYRLAGTLSENLLKTLCQAWSNQALPVGSQSAPQQPFNSPSTMATDQSPPPAANMGRKRLKINPDPYRYDR